MTIEEFLARTQQCVNEQELGRLFAGAIASAAYQNVTFARINESGFLAIPFLEMPERSVETYFQEKCDRDDAVLTHARTTGQPFYWRDLECLPTTSQGGRRTFEICREVNVHSGFTVPFHGPGGAVDLIGVSLRDERVADPQATGRVVALASIMRWRYWQLRNMREAMAVTIESEPEHAMPGPFGMTTRHCRGLVMIDIAEHRRRMGLEQMSRTLSSYVEESVLEELLSWGLAAEYPDDSVFHYHIVASPLGSCHLATCPDAARHRRAAWQALVPRSR